MTTRSLALVRALEELLESAIAIQQYTRRVLDRLDDYSLDDARADLESLEVEAVPSLFGVFTRLVTNLEEALDDVGES